MVTIIRPNFKEWAENLVGVYNNTDAVAKALEAAFNQGHTLGYREGSEMHEPGHRGAY